MADQLAGGESVLVGNGDDLVVDPGVQHVGHKASADALDLVGAGNTLAQHRRGGRLNSHDLDVGVLALEVVADTGHGAAGADTGNEDIDLTVGVLPDLGAGGCLVGGGVGRIDELAGHKGVGDLLSQLVSLGDGTLHALGAVGQDQLSAIGLHQLAALHAHGLGHDDDDAVALGSCHGSQAEAGIAGGGLDDDRAGLEDALGLGVIDHGLGDTVLDRAGRVEVLQLSQDLGLQALGSLDMSEFQQRSMADQLVSGSVDFAHGGVLLIYIR